MRNVFRLVLLAALACVALCRTLDNPRRESSSLLAQSTHHEQEMLLEVHRATVC